MVRLSEGIAELAGGNARHWPFGAVLSTSQSRSIWHAWASQMPAALEATADVTGDRHLRRTALRDSFTFVPWLLTSGGADNGRMPSRTDGTQIAYGVDSRVQNLIAMTGRGDDGAGQLAGMTPRSSAPTLRARRRTTRQRASPSTASPRTAPSTATPARSRRSTDC